MIGQVGFQVDLWIRESMDIRETLRNTLLSSQLASSIFNGIVNLITFLFSFIFWHIFKENTPVEIQIFIFS